MSDYLTAETQSAQRNTLPIVIPAKAGIQCFLENSKMTHEDTKFLDAFDTSMLDIDLKSIFEFIIETGKLKSIIRQNYMPAQDRRENSAEHSWHVVLMAMALKDYANEPININKVIKMMVLHDLGEIDGGDTFHYDKNAKDNTHETRCFERITSALPEHIKTEFRNIWNEFEEAKTPEAKFAQAIDRFHPFLYQLENGGEAWRRRNISRKTALQGNEHINQGSEILWSIYKSLSEQALKKGMFND